MRKLYHSNNVNKFSTILFDNIQIYIIIMISEYYYYHDLRVIRHYTYLIDNLFKVSNTFIPTRIYIG